MGPKALAYAVKRSRTVFVCAIKLSLSPPSTDWRPDPPSDAILSSQACEACSIRILTRSEHVRYDLNYTTVTTNPLHHALGYRSFLGLYDLSTGENDAGQWKKSPI